MAKKYSRPAALVVTLTIVAAMQVIAVGPANAESSRRTPEIRHELTRSESSFTDLSPREPAGQYVYTCLLENGKTVTLGTTTPKKGACRGWVSSSIGGKQVASVNTGGTLGPGDKLSCLFSGGVFLMSLFGGPVGWGTAGGIVSLGLGCTGW
ncbi:hypothetical protein [Frondihabitans peucedani]|uniref:Uncharacterized protein n=1 Tax=Frondihabitans peucedani TaxID=598626 RepID=A0ABP8E4Z2_9MICO